MVEDLPVITPAACADYYGSLIYSGIMCIDAAGGKGVCNVSPTSVFSQDLRVAKFSRDLRVAKFLEIYVWLYFLNFYEWLNFFKIYFKNISTKSL